MASVGDGDEAAVGARGLSGPGYRGHVFWDADTFVLPFLAATHPRRHGRCSSTASVGCPQRCDGAPEPVVPAPGSPGSRPEAGDDVTPLSARDRTGRVVPIRTGQLEEHIVAAGRRGLRAATWTGPATRTSRGPGARLLVETARYWASRCAPSRDGSAHIYGVIGPDEYHEPVDDNAFTNVMARWNLRRAADAVAKRRRWMSMSNETKLRELARARGRARRRLRREHRDLRAVRRLLRARAADHRGDRAAPADRRRPAARSRSGPARRRSSSRRTC